MLNDFIMEVIWDEEKALKLAAGRVALLKTILSLFPPMARANLQEIEGSLDDSAKFAKLVHSIQGAASQIAAERAHKMGVYIESEVREGDAENALKLWPEYRATVEQTISVIEDWLNAASSDIAKNSMSASGEQQQQQIAEVDVLIEMLSAGKADAGFAFAKTRPLLEKSVPQVTIRELDGLIVNFDYDKAADLLRKHFVSRHQS